ncbi:ABC transporter ATP-binding protein [Azospirillum halopraeferens]|uniref:ABC transporter ATP-binding protein n=1 Tax=Azospirillum halopraeferens TaxID=34010 RepID=UPI000406F495|nr:ATP-binding cassette domain-containing protein [Azospirillum halopraeferens]
MRLVIQGLVKTMHDAGRRFTLVVPRFSMAVGETVALVGPSGSGKTTLLELLGLVSEPSRVTAFRLEGDGEAVDIAALWQRRRRAALARLRSRRFGFVLQAGGLFPFLSANANASLPLHLFGAPDPVHLATLMARVGLEDVAALRPAKLSIGQRQRVAIVRALVHRPAFVIADEPTSALDPDTADSVLSLLLDTAAEQKTGVILSSHNIGLIERHNLRRIELARWSGEADHYVSALGAA